MSNHLGTLSGQLRHLADVLLNEPSSGDMEPPTVTERVRAAAVAIESLPCEHEAADLSLDYSRCRYCKVPLRRVWAVDGDDEPT